VAAAATVTGGWISAKEVKFAKINSTAGAGAGTFALKIEQATSSGGAGAKDLATAAVLGITAQANVTQVQVDYNVADNIDTDNSFAFIRLSATCTGGAGTLYTALLELGPAYRQA
jgi:hypothetical protein